MTDADAASRARRVVALLPAGADPPEVHPDVEVVSVNSGYEAAAELLTGPAAALAVDLGRITASHVPLLDLADRLSVPVVGFGTISAEISSERLSRLRLTGPDRLGEVLAKVLRPAPPGAAAAGIDTPTPPHADGPPAPAHLEPRKTRRPVRALSPDELDALLGDET